MLRPIMTRKDRTYLILLFLYANIGIQQVSGELMGYDCSYNTAEYATIDITRAETCEIPLTNVLSQSVEIQLVQLADVITLDIYMCKIRVNRLISHCGMHNHASMVANGYMSYPYIIGRDRCQQAVLSGELCLFCGTSQQILLHNLIAGQSLTRPIMFGGSVDEFGRCQGSLFSDVFGHWKDVVVQGSVEVSIDSLRGEMNIDLDKLHLPNGMVCQGSKETCQDILGGEYYWKVVPDDTCNTNKHIVLYEGPANITKGQSQDLTKSEEIITVSSGDTSFSVQIKTPYSVCNLIAHTTEHPKLVIIYKTGASFYFKRFSTRQKPSDLFTYINSKFVYVERNTRTNMESLYRAIMEQHCKIMQHSLDLLLTVARINPNEFAYMYTSSPGYTATRLGEVIYVTKCHPVIVKIRHSTICYDELPVTYKNASYFLSPRSRLIQKHGTEITCNPIFAPQYQIGLSWYKFNSRPIEVGEPTHLIPGNTINISHWKYHSITHLATAGIYTQDDLDSLRDHLLYGLEKPAVENIIVRGATGRNPDMQGTDMGELLSLSNLDTIATTVGQQVWGFLSTFGHVSATIIGIASIAKIIKWLIDAFINGTLLFEVYGFSYHLVACGLDSLTHCLVYKYQQSKQPPSSNQASAPEQEMLTAVTTAETNIIRQPENSPATHQASDTSTNYNALRQELYRWEDRAP